MGEGVMGWAILLALESFIAGASVALLALGDLSRRARAGFAITLALALGFGIMDLFFIYDRLA